MHSTAPKFVGPHFDYHNGYTDYFFSCEISVAEDENPNIIYDVFMLFDGVQDTNLPVKQANAVRPKAYFGLSDFGTHFEQQVRY